MQIRRPAGAALVATLCASLTLSACGGSDSGSEAAKPGGKTELTVSLFGTFGYDEVGLFKKYESLHPDITIKYDATQQEQNYWSALQTKIAAGKGASDVQGIEVSRITDVVANQSDKWADLKSTPAGAQVANYPDWKTKAATTSDGKVLGMGTDIGPTALCYRTDLMEKAGLPSEPEKLAARLGSWDDFLALGREYQTKAGKKSAWHDSASGLYNVVVSTEQKIYYDETGKLVWDSNPAVKNAFDIAARAGQEGLTSRVTQFSPEWNKAMASGGFATIACPSWMIGYIKGQAGDSGKGKWNVTSLPGGKGGNWGGAYLGIPASSEHKAQAAELVKWLTDAQQQADVFNKVGNFPSNKEAFTLVADTKDDYFSDAPIGTVFSQIASSAPTQILGKDDGVMKDQISKALVSAEPNKVAPDAAWANVAKELKNQLG